MYPYYKSFEEAGEGGALDNRAVESCNSRRYEERGDGFEHPRHERHEHHEHHEERREEYRREHHSDPDPHFLEMLMEALRDKATDIQVKEQLMSKAACHEDREIIKHIWLEEQKHYKLFQHIYCHFTGKTPHAEPENVCVSEDRLYNYGQSIFSALNEVDFYRKICFCLHEKELKDMLYEIITDEQAHGTKFTYIYAKNK